MFQGISKHLKSPHSPHIIYYLFISTSVILTVSSVASAFQYCGAAS